MGCSGVLKATASGGRPMSPTVTTEAGVPGESSARVLVPAEEAFGSRNRQCNNPVCVTNLFTPAHEWVKLLCYSFLSVSADLRMEVVIVQGPRSIIRSVIQRTVPAHTRTSERSSASSAATNTTITSNTRGCRMNTLMVREMQLNHFIHFIY